MTETKFGSNLTPRDRQFLFAYNPFLYMRRLMTRWLQVLFSKNQPGDYRFTSHDDQNSEIVIYSGVRWEPEAQERRPALVMTRTLTTANNPGFGAGPMVQSTQFVTDHKRKTALISGQFVVNTVSRSDDEAESLAWRVMFWSMEHIELLNKFFHYLTPPSVGAVSPAPDALVQSSTPEWLVCQVVYPFTFQYSWASYPKEQMRVQSIEVELVDEEDQIYQAFMVKRPKE